MLSHPTTEAARFLANRAAFMIAAALTVALTAVFVWPISEIPSDPLQVHDGLRLHLVENVLVVVNAAYFCLKTQISIFVAGEPKK